MNPSLASAYLNVSHQMYDYKMDSYSSTLLLIQNVIMVNSASYKSFLLLFMKYI